MNICIHEILYIPLSEIIHDLPFFVKIKTQSYIFLILLLFYYCVIYNIFI